MSEFAEHGSGKREAFPRDRLNMRERAETTWFAAELARIDKAQAEIQKCAAETRKLQAEASAATPAGFGEVAKCGPKRQSSRRADSLRPGRC